MKKILIVLLTMVLLLAGCGKMGLHRHNLPLMNLWRIGRNPLLPKPKYHLKIMRFPEVIPSRRDGRNLRSILLIRRFSI